YHPYQQYLKVLHRPDKPFRNYQRHNSLIHHGVQWYETKLQSLRPKSQLDYLQIIVKRLVPHQFWHSHRFCCRLSLVLYNSSLCGQSCHNSSTPFFFRIWTCLFYSLTWIYHDPG
ncbi:hypothetical protein PanWU01x14_289040, partial [Parasponia andersonii]